MKKFGLIVLCILLLGVFAGCSSSDSSSDSGNSKTAGPAKSSEKVKETDDFLYTTSNMDYTLYMNIYYNDMGANYLNTKMNTIGTFTTVQDRYSNRTRYYVWGYLDETKCCDWQWELKLPEGYDLPANGSLVQVNGVFTKDSNALDSYWWTNVSMKVLTPHTPSTVDVDASLMNATLERVQLYNLNYAPADFEGKTVSMYGRVASPTIIQHPYYDGAWEIEIGVKGTMPPLGSMVLVNGTFSEGIIRDAEVTVTDRYY